MLFEEATGGVGVVVGEDDDLLHCRRGQTRNAGDGLWAVGGAGLAGVGADADFDGIVGAVVAALGLGELGAAGEGAGTPQGVHGGFGAGVGESDHVEGGDALAQEAGEFHLVLIGGVVDEALGGLLLDGLDHLRVCVAEDEAGHAVGEVDALGAVEVPEAAALAVVCEHGIGVPEDAGAAVATGHVLLGVLPSGPRPGCHLVVAFEFGGVGHGATSCPGWGCHICSKGALSALAAGIISHGAVILFRFQTIQANGGSTLRLPRLRLMACLRFETCMACTPGALAFS